MSNLPELIVLRTEDLFQFLGEVALPPYPPNDSDCAPIAQKLTDWVSQNRKNYHIVVPSYERMQNR